MTTVDGRVTAAPDALDGDLRQEAIDRLLDDSGDEAWSAVHPYRKWQGAHWRLVSLAELGERTDPRLREMLDRVLEWLLGAGHIRGVKVIDGRARRCASQEGNALFAASCIGAADAAADLAENLVAWQWPDGGWNCDRRPATTHSSFHESVWPLRGLAAHHAATGDPPAWDAACRAAEFLLRHRLFRSERTGAVIDDELLTIRWPPYWHYDVLQGLRGITAVGLTRREEATDALEWLRQLQRDDATWAPSGKRWWKRPGRKGSGVEVVAWGDLADQVVTGQARAVLARATAREPTAG